MAVLGHEVVLVERYRVPRSRIGEALAAGIWPLLDAIGAAAEIANCHQVQIWDSYVRWAARTTADVHRPGPPSVIVDRGEFDRVLLEQAIDAGVTVIAETTAQRPRRRRDGWSVGGARANIPTTINARFVADASGRAKVLGGAVARATPTRLPPSVAQPRPSSVTRPICRRENSTIARPPSAPMQSGHARSGSTAR